MSDKITCTKDFLKELTKGRNFWGSLNGKLCYIKVTGDNSFHIIHFGLDGGELDIARKTPPPIDTKFYHTKGVYEYCYRFSEKNSV